VFGGGVPGGGDGGVSGGVCGGFSATGVVGVVGVDELLLHATACVKSAHKSSTAGRAGRIFIAGISQL
jgi:hypothetical protein